MKCKHCGEDDPDFPVCDACCDAIDEAKRQRLMAMEVDEMQTYQEPGGLTPTEASAIRHERTRV